MLPSEILIWQPEFTDKTLSRKPGAVHDDDAMIICECMARLKKNNSDLHDLLVDYYVGGMTFMALARKHGRSDCWVGRMLQKAEGVVEGMLMVLDLRLEMDADCSK
ncbi:antiterminator Q family protein [Escherichia coli]|uniref:antiterminator Q family protein n=1 Tax=Escherichia coli TaxID=562 RepID=UPI00092FCB74|nr:antiterminator Q family protein [Escherichia coli]